MNHIVFSEGFRFFHHHYDKSHTFYCKEGAPAHYFAYIEKGRYKIFSDQGTMEFKEGDVFYLPSGLKYRSYWYGEPEVSVRSFAFSLFPETKTAQYRLQKVPCEAETADRLTEIPIGNAVNCEALGLFYSVVAELLPAMKSDARNESHIIYETAVEYLHQNPQQAIPEVAKYCNVSPSKLYDVFKKESGVSPNVHRQKILVERAVLLLSTTDLSVQQISNMLGFSSEVYFRKVLHQYMQKTPTEIRREFTTL